MQLFVTLGQDELSPLPTLSPCGPRFAIQIPLLVWPTRGLLCSCAEILSGWFQVGPAQVDPSVEVTRRETVLQPTQQERPEEEGGLDRYGRF